LNKNRQSTIDSFSNRLKSMTENAAAFRTYTYDGAGNIVTDVRPGESFAYTYNKRNRLVSVTRNGAAYATYTYNALEQLTSRTTSAAGGPTGTIHYIYDLDGHLIIEANGLASGVTTAIITLREYIWLPSNDNHMQVAGGAMGEALGLGSLAANDNNPVDLPLAIVDTVNTTPTLLMVHADHLGRPIRMTDATKATVWQASYKPWGETQSISGTKANNLRLPGQYFQIETNLAYNWHRHYDPVTGRYTQPDPLRFVDGPSVYAYARSSPFMYTDRDGQIAFLAPLIPIVVEAIGAAVTAATPYIVAGAGLAVGAGAGLLIFKPGSDRVYPQEMSIPEVANQRQYKRICDEPEPPGMDLCEKAQWNLQKAQNCLAARKENNNLHHGGEDLKHNPQTYTQLQNKIDKSLKEIERFCSCQK
jgi:RHS repeat-associated protein